ncbi:hypothetical protein IE53DRAFT_248548 [Violaceomyces palustris]|uniref:Uncharacterized protein n=1 Tax=Violaceomyces palustris TaxID=1673888 RepID=A0ACD0P4B6_9BASI|nr:hypothetical protein IE53DRAFT_248548 [Violaceomyces palustris]
MVGMPRGRRESFISHAGEHERRSSTPSSDDNYRHVRQGSVPGHSSMEPQHYDDSSEFWSSQVARHHRLSLPFPPGSDLTSFRGPYPHPQRDHLSQTAASSWQPHGHGTPLSAVSDQHHRSLAYRQASSPSKREFSDHYSRHPSAGFDGSATVSDLNLRPGSIGSQPFARSDGRSSDYGPTDESTAAFHRRSSSSGSLSKGYSPSVPPSAFPSGGSTTARGVYPGDHGSVGSGPPASLYGSSAPASGFVSARSSRSPKSGSLQNVVPGSDSGSPSFGALERFSSQPYGTASKAASSFGKAGTILPGQNPGATAFGARTRIHSGGGSVPPASGSGCSLYQHPYSSDRSTTLESMGDSRDMSPAGPTFFNDPGSDYGGSPSRPISRTMRATPILPPPSTSSLPPPPLHSEEKIILPPLNTAVPPRPRWR